MAEANFYSDILQVLDDVTGAVIPELGAAPQLLTIITRTWSGGARDKGVPTDTQFVCPKKYWMKLLKTQEVTNDGGRYETGDIEVSGIVPNHPANGPSQGVTEAQIMPSPTVAGVEIIYRISTTGGGAHEGDYTRLYADTVDAYNWKLVLRRRRTSPNVLSPPSPR